LQGLAAFCLDLGIWYAKSGFCQAAEDRHPGHSVAKAGKSRAAGAPLTFNPSSTFPCFLGLSSLGTRFRTEAVQRNKRDLFSVHAK
jgi:hypothetical protein